MNHFDKRIYLKILISSLLIMGIIFILVAIIFSPEFVRHSYYSDGYLLKINFFRIKILRLFFCITGSLLVIYGFLKIVKNDITLKIDVFLKNTILWIKQPSTLILIIFFFLAFVYIIRIVELTMNESWKKATGYEYYWIAQNIADGHGYTFKANHRWLFRDQHDSENDYYPTAWEEPVYTYFLAFSYRYIGNYAPLFIIAIQIILYYLTGILIYLLIKEVFKSRLGILFTILFLIFWPDVHYLTEGNFSASILGGFGISVSVYLFFLFLENISIKRGIILGIVLGLTSLTLAASILIVPIMVLITLFNSYKRKNVAWKQSLTILVAFGLVILPWAIRNFLVFGEIVLIRNAAGQGLHMSNLIAASTFYDGKLAHEDVLGPIWHVDNAEQATLAISDDFNKSLDIFVRADKVIELEAPPNYYQFNEAQRDKFYLHRAIDFIVSNPKIFIVLTYSRLKLFLKGWRTRHSIMTLLVLISVIFSWKNRKVLFLVFMVLGYIFVFSLIIALYYRYRYPVEPLFFVLSSGLIIYMLNSIKNGSIKIINKYFEKRKNLNHIGFI